LRNRENNAARQGEDHLMADVDFLEQWVLLAVRRLQPHATSLLVQEEIAQRTGRSPGNVYIPLYALEKKGFIKRSAPSDAAGGRIRKQPRIITLTEQGQRTLDAWLRSLDALRSPTTKLARRKPKSPSSLFKVAS
jgi:DNA-binding PadR family transcriptional regulator